MLTENTDQPKGLLDLQREGARELSVDSAETLQISDNQWSVAATSEEAVFSLLPTLSDGLLVSKYCKSRKSSFFFF